MTLPFDNTPAHDLHIQYVGRFRRRQAYWECSCGQTGPVVSPAEAEFGAQMHLEENQQAPG